MTLKECCSLSPFFLCLIFDCVDEQLSLAHKVIMMPSFATAPKPESQPSTDSNFQECIKISFSLYNLIILDIVSNRKLTVYIVTATELKVSLI